MTFLPIVTRELLVAARRRSTFWVRVIAALVALVIGTGCLMMFQVFGTTAFGSGLFSVLTWLSFAAAFATGLFFTADCLSEEKREGTLGFLFLTDLRGYDVAFGKLLATSLRGSFAFVAIFPVLAITLLMGGVTGPQFWRASFAVINALVCSLAAGMLISALSRDPQKAFAGTFALLLLLGAGGPAADGVWALAHGGSFRPVLALSSPCYVFSIADAWGRNPFWLGLLINQAVAGLFLALASVLVRRTWQEKPARAQGLRGAWSYAWRYGRAKRRLSLRRKLLVPNPVLWLACRERWQATGIWILATVGTLTFVVLLASSIPPQFWVGWTPIGGVLVAALYLWAASQACRFFVEGRRSGLLELILVSPVEAHRIIQGQWQALWRMFGAPVVILVGLDVAGGCLAQQVTWASAASQAGLPISQALLVALNAASSALVTLANLLALAWFGIWMGLSSKNTSLATLKTILFVQVIPWMVIKFVSAMAIGMLMLPLLARRGAAGMGASIALAIPLTISALGTVLTLVKDYAFFAVARRRLSTSLREMATRSLEPMLVALAPVPPLAITKPPPIPARS